MSDAFHLVCPNCDQVNRIPTARLGEGPKCGHCHQSLFAGHPLELSSANFQRHIGRNDIPVVVDFWAPWCGPCRAMSPAVEAAAEKLAGNARVFKMNVDDNPSVSPRFNILGIPTLILFKDGREANRLVGLSTKDQIEALVTSS